LSALRADLRDKQGKQGTASLTHRDAAQQTDPSGRVEGRGWSALAQSGATIVSLSGDWIGRDTGVEPGAPARVLAVGGQGLAFEAPTLGHWDSALLAFLSTLRSDARAAGKTFDDAGLPGPARLLLTLVSDPAPAQPPMLRPPLLDRVGFQAIGLFAESVEIATLIGNTCLRSGAALCRRAGMRGGDLVEAMRDAGPAALAIVAVVNLLVGGILAFVGAVQLRRFGADIYVASLVGISVVREMAALMTAIIMSGRTGGAYAAQIATMQGNEEIDALRVVGIPVFDYLVLPRVLALTAMMPILYLWGCAIGIFGGFVVAVATLDLSPISYFEETRSAVAGSQFGLGLAKSLAFGALIAITGCRVGLRAGRSAADVGRAATTAVVAAIVGVIALDAIFAVCANALGI
jgi:phospholipid/cholesterol/gamma-HCH transport system permease protein